MEEPPQRLATPAMEPNGGAPALEAEDIHKCYGGLEVLRGVSMSARAGDVVSIIGSSGSGKSTFLRCLNFLEIPDRGRVRVGGKEIRVKIGRGGAVRGGDEKQFALMRRSLGFVFQSFNLWPHMTALENVVEGPIHVLKRPKAEARGHAEAWLDKVGVADKRHSFPSHLSGGQQQRVAIARALAMEPQAILFDEPTSSLDPELVAEVLGVMRGLAEEGRTMLIVTHEMDFAREVSHRVIFLHRGRIEEQGGPDKVLGEPQSDRLRQFLSSHLQRSRKAH